MEFLHQLGTLDFWKTLLDGFGDLGPLAPIALAMVEDAEKSGALLTTGRTVNTYTDMHTGRIVRLPKEKLTALIDLSKGDRE